MDELTGIGDSHITGSDSLNPDYQSKFNLDSHSADPTSIKTEGVAESSNPDVILADRSRLESNCKMPLDVSTRRGKTVIGRLVFKLYAPLSKWIKKVVAKIQGKQYAEVVRVVHLCQADTRLFQNGWIDTPQKKDKLYSSVISIGGWVMGKQFQPVAVRLIFNELILAESPLNVPRPDVVKSYFSKHIDFGHRINFGYSLLVAAETIPDEADLILEAIFPSGEIAPVALIRFSKYGF